MNNKDVIKVLIIIEYGENKMNKKTGRKIYSFHLLNMFYIFLYLSNLFEECQTFARTSNKKV